MTQRCPISDARCRFQDSLFCGIDHIAIVVADTEEALRFYRVALGLPLLFSEVLEDQAVRLTIWTRATPLCNSCSR